MKNKTFSMYTVSEVNTDMMFYTVMYRAAYNFSQTIPVESVDQPPDLYSSCIPSSEKTKHKLIKNALHDHLQVMVLKNS